MREKTSIASVTLPVQSKTIPKMISTAFKELKINMRALESIQNSLHEENFGEALSECNDLKQEVEEFLTLISAYSDIIREYVHTTIIATVDLPSAPQITDSNVLSTSLELGATPDPLSVNADFPNSEKELELNVD